MSTVAILVRNTTVKNPFFAVCEIADADGAFLCACHGSRFDLAGRVYRNVPAPTNLVVPPHRYLSDSVILIGEHPETA